MSIALMTKVETLTKRVEELLRRIEAIEQKLAASKPGPKPKDAA